MGQIRDEILKIQTALYIIGKKDILWESYSTTKKYTEKNKRMKRFSLLQGVGVAWCERAEICKELESWIY